MALDDGLELDVEQLINIQNNAENALENGITTDYEVDNKFVCYGFSDLFSDISYGLGKISDCIPNPMREIENLFRYKNK